MTEVKNSLPGEPLDETLVALVTLDIPLADAIRVALGRRYGIPSYKAVSVLAREYGLNPTNSASAIASQRPAPDDLIAALIAKLGGTPARWKELLWLAGRPADGSTVSAA